MLFLIPTIPAIVIGLFVPGLKNTTGKSTEGIAGGLVVLGLFLGPFIATPLVTLGCYLEKHYDLWGYKTDMGTQID